MEGEEGEPGQGEERRGEGRGKRLKWRSARSTDGGGVLRGEGAAPGRKRRGRLPHPSSGSQPPPVVWSVPSRAMPRRGRWWAGEGGWSRCPPPTPPPQAQASFA